MTISIPTGMFDILPEDPKEYWRSAHLWHYVESIMRELARVYGFEEIRTPMLERTELFKRGVGDSTDVVSKEMYTFEDRGGRSLSMRPEYTASVVRAFIEKKLHTLSQQHRLFYIGPMFRYERPQSGRFRQHHQFGVEVIGISQPELDAELIGMCYALYERLGLHNLNVYINTLGDKESRARFREALISYLKPHFETLSAESRNRFELNPLRIFDSKDERDREVMKNAPTILEYLSPECEMHFAEVQRILNHLKVPYQVNAQLVRGLDYYTKTVFEITAGELGAQNTIGAGGRYDGLIAQLGGPDLPSIGFATGIERILQTLIGQKVPLPERQSADLYLITLDDEAELAAFTLAKQLRQQGIACLQEISGKKLKQAMQIASNSGAIFVVVLGENELKTGICEIKEMKLGTTTKVAISEIALFIQTHSKKAKIT